MKIAIALILALLTACDPKTRAPQTRPSASAAPSTAPSASHAPSASAAPRLELPPPAPRGFMKSYSMPYGPDRSSCVQAPVRPRYTLRLLGDLESFADGYDLRFQGELRHVLVSPAGSHLAAVWDRLLAVRPRNAQLNTYSTGKAGPSGKGGTSEVWFTATGFWEGGEEYQLSGERLSQQARPSLPAGHLFFAELASDVLLSAGFMPSDIVNHPEPGKPYHIPPYVRVTANRISKDSRGKPTSEHLWGAGDYEFLRGEGVAVLTEDHRIAVAMRDGTFVIFDGMTGTHLVERKLEHAPFELARMHDGFVALAKREGGTQVTFLDDKGTARWSTAIDITALDPPVRGAEGRVHVVGQGWVTLDAAGAIVARSKTEERARATAFASGALVIVTGPRLELRKSDGTLFALTGIPNGAELITPPAIGPEGRVYVATRQEVFVAE